MKSALCLALSLVAITARGEGKADPAAPLFDHAVVRTLHLTLAPDQWKAIEPTRSREAGIGGGFGRKMKYPVVRATVDFDGRAYPDVAVRYKGNSSFMMARNGLKKSLKLDFNRFVEHRTFFGLTGVNLNNNAGDATAARETLGYELFAAAGVPSARTAAVRVELTVPGLYDRKFIGLYTMVEEIGKRFLKAHYADAKGLLLKPEMARGLPYLGETWEAYERQYGPKTDGDDATRLRFIALLKLAQQGTDAEFDRSIESYLDVDEFLRFVAVNAVTSNLDSLFSMGHNFYVYVPSGKDARVQFIPWDLNECFGGFGMGMPPQTQERLSLMHPHAGEIKLIERLLAVPRFKAAYQKAVADLAAGPFSVPAMHARIDAFAKLTADLRAEEAKAGLTVNAPGGPPPPRNDGPGGGQPNVGGGRPPGGPGGGPGFVPRVKPELKAFVATRNQSIAEQLAGKSTGEIPTNMRGGPGGGPGGRSPGRPGGPEGNRGSDAPPRRE